MKLFDYIDLDYNRRMTRVKAGKESIVKATLINNLELLRGIMQFNREHTSVRVSSGSTTLYIVIVTLMMMTVAIFGNYVMSVLIKVAIVKIQSMKLAIGLTLINKILTLARFLIMCVIYNRIIAFFMVSMGIRPIKITSWTSTTRDQL